MQVLPWQHAARPARGIVGAAASASLRSRPRRFRFVCASCQHQQQQQASSFSSSPAPPTKSQRPPPPPALPRSTGYARLTSRRLISIAGVDAPRFLQGIITSSIERSDPTGFYTGFLNATGRVLHDVFIYPDTLGLGGSEKDPGQAFLIEVDADQVGALVRHLRRYMLRSQLKVRALEEDGEGGCNVWHVWNDDALDAGMASFEQQQQQQQPGTIVLRDDRAPGLGYRVLSTQSAQSGGLPPAPITDSLGLEKQADEEAYRIRRYLRGVPEGQAEIPRGAALPLESNLDLMMGGIDFRKGCYVGQELTIRTKHRGVVRKRILPCVVYDENAPQPPEQLEYRPNDGNVDAGTIPADLSIGRAGKRGRSAGTWLRGVGNVGLALCRLQAMTDVQLPGETATAPFDPGDEFVLRWGAEGEGKEGESGEGEEVGEGKAVKIKAFVPEWLRTKLDESNRPSH